MNATRIENAADRKDRPAGAKWASSWTAAMQGPAPAGVPAALPDQSFALPGYSARNQTFRMVIRPDLWGRLVRLRFSNAYGDRAIKLGAVRVALHAGSGALVPGTTARAKFATANSVSLPCGNEILSDPIELPFVDGPSDAALIGRKLAVSFHVEGETGPLTWHAKAMTTSYISPPDSGVLSEDESDAAFPHTTTAWHFLDGLDVAAPSGATVVAALGDSITDGTFATLNGDDRWSDRLSRRLHVAYGNYVSVVNVGIGGNQVVGPATYPPPFNGGPSALDRLKRDILSRAGITHVIWVEGVNDFGQAFAPPGTPSATAQAVIEGFRTGAKRMQAAGIKVIVGTLPPSLNATREVYGAPETDARRREVNAFIRTSGIFDGVVDFEAATMDAATGEFKAEFQPDSTLGGPPDRLHPNRAGYLAMGDAVDLSMLAPRGSD